MELQENIKSLLKTLKSKGFDRRMLEHKLGHAEKSIDQILSKGGSEKLLKQLENFNTNIEGVITDG